MEQRQHPRPRLVGPAMITVDSPDDLMDCLVTEWSNGGAILQFANADTRPDLFTLVTMDGLSEHCEVAWRQGNKVGVRFLYALL